MVYEKIKALRKYSSLFSYPKQEVEVVVGHTETS